MSQNRERVLRFLATILTLIAIGLLGPGVFYPMFRLSITTGDPAIDSLSQTYAPDLVGEQTMSLYGLVRFLFDHHEYLIGAAILVFSIVFPAVKVAILSVLLLVRSDRHSHVRHFAHAFVERTGGWSFLDVFVIAVLIASLNSFPFASVQRLAGLYFFSAAVMCSMVASIAIGPLLKIESRHQVRKTNTENIAVAGTHGSSRMIAGVFVVGAGTFLLPGLLLPSFSLFKTTGNALRDRIIGFEIPHLMSDTTVSIVGSVKTLLTEGNVVLGLLILLFGICIPFSKITLMVFLLSKKPASTSKWRKRADRLLETFSGWSLLTVFAGAIVVAGMKDFPGGTRIEWQIGMTLFVTAALLSFVAEIVVVRLYRVPYGQTNFTKE